MAIGKGHARAVLGRIAVRIVGIAARKATAQRKQASAAVGVAYGRAVVSRKLRDVAHVVIAHSLAHHRTCLNSAQQPVEGIITVVRGLRHRRAIAPSQLGDVPVVLRGTSAQRIGIVHLLRELRGGDLRHPAALVVAITDAADKVRTPVLAVELFLYQLAQLVVRQPALDDLRLGVHLLARILQTAHVVVRVRRNQGGHRGRTCDTVLVRARQQITRKAVAVGVSL